MLILFQGDSITDDRRRREEPNSLGEGYPAYVAARMGLLVPASYTFLNKGVSGDRIVDVYARIKTDIINLHPDFMSLLVGVNDVWHEVCWQNGVDAEKFHKIYGMLLFEVRNALPNTKIMIMEPFVQDGSLTRDILPMMQKEVKLRSEAAQDIANQFGCLFMPLQQDLDDLIETAPASHWLEDGIHPTIYFHQYIADKWMKAFNACMPEE